MYLGGKYAGDVESTYHIIKKRYFPIEISTNMNEMSISIQPIEIPTLTKKAASAIATHYLTSSTWGTLETCRNTRLLRTGQVPESK